MRNGFYDNCKRSGQWVDMDEVPTHSAKRDIHRKKLILSVWWSNARVIHINEVWIIDRSGSLLNDAVDITTMAKQFCKLT